jgi:regulator of sigma E protease
MSHILTGICAAGFLPTGLLDSTLNVFIVILGVGFLIFVHELGHFAVAKWADVKVEAFSLGFGPALIKWTRGETEYRLSIIPLGGYVKMAGEGLPEDAGTIDPRELRAKSAGVRAAVFSAGVVMNAITAIVLFVIVFAVGVDLPPPVVGPLIPGSSAWTAGIQPGDRILDINGHEPIDFEDMASEMAYADEDEDLHVRYERRGEVHEAVLRATRSEGSLVPTVGLIMHPDLSHLPISGRVRVIADSAAEKAGLKTGDLILSVNGQRTGDPRGVWHLLLDRSETVRVEVDRDGETLGLEVTPEPIEGKKLIGIEPYNGEIIEVRPDSPAQAAGFKVGDLFVRVGDTPTTSSRDWARALRNVPPPGAPIVTVLRADKEVSMPVTFDSVGERRRIFESLRWSDHATTRFSYVSDNTIPGNPVRRAQIPEGASITKVNDKSVANWSEIIEAIGDEGDDPIRLGWKVEGGEEQTSGPLVKVKSRQFDLGIQWIVAKERVREDIGTAIGVGWQRSWLMAKRVVLTIRGIFTGSISGQALGGPVTIFRVASSYAEQSLMELILFLGLLSVNLAIINLLPIPILDGGHLFFLLIEKVKGSPVSDRTFGLAQWVGLALILALLVYVTFNDILRMI